MEYVPYTYLIGWSKLDLWYYGSEYGHKTKIANPSNLWNTYFTSSRYVQEIRESYGDPDVIQVRKTFNTADQTIKWEERVLSRMNVLYDSKWINRNVSGAILNTPNDYITIGKKQSATKQKLKSEGKLVAHNKGKLGFVSKTPELTKAKMRVSTTTRWQTLSSTELEEISKKRSEAAKGKLKSAAHKQAISNYIKQLKWYNNGIISYRYKPGTEPLGWSKGRKLKELT